MNAKILIFFRHSARIIPAVGAFFFSALIVGLLDPNDSGIAFVALAAAQLGAMIALFGGNSFYLRDYAARIGVYDEGRKGLNLTKLYIFLVGALAVLVICYFVNVQGVDQVYFLAASAPFMALMVLNGAVLRAFDSVVLAGLFGYGLVACGVLLLSPLIYLYVGFDLVSISIAYFFVSIILWFASEIFVFRGVAFVRNLNNFSLRGCFYFKSWRIGVMTVVIYLTQWLPIFVLQSYSLESVAIVSLAYRYAAILSFLGVTLDLAFGPLFARLGRSNDKEALREIIRRIVRVLAPFSLIACVSLMVFVVVSDFYFLAHEYQGLLSVSFVVFVSAGVLFVLSPFTNLLIMLGREDVCNRSSILCFAFVAIGVLLGCSMIHDVQWLSLYVVIIYAVGKVSASSYSVYVVKKTIFANKSSL